VTALADTDDEERDRHVLTGDRENRERVKELVVAEYRGDRIGATPCETHPQGGSPVSRLVGARGSAAEEVAARSPFGVRPHRLASLSRLLGTRARARGGSATRTYGSGLSHSLEIATAT
jgi:hypothetical protein